MESRKMVSMNLFSGSSGETDIENRLVDTGQGEGEGGLNGESSLEIYTLPYLNRKPVGTCGMTQKTQLGLYDNPEGWDGVGVGKGVQGGRDICIPMVDSC